jgi:hypothetical protein
MKRKVLLICGILSSILYVAMCIFVPLQYEGYNSASYTISELSAIGAPTRTLWIWPGILYTLLVAAFGYGVWQSATENRWLRVAGVLFTAYGLIGIAWAFAPMHQREVLAAGGDTLTDTMHIAMAAISSLLMVVSMGFAAATLGKGFRLYSIATILILLVFGILTSLETPKVEADLPTPMVGVWERILIGVFLLWTIVLTIILLRKKVTANN